jgi:hypothetical protein
VLIDSKSLEILIQWCLDSLVKSGEVRTSIMKPLPLIPINWPHFFKVVGMHDMVNLNFSINTSAFSNQSMIRPSLIHYNWEITEVVHVILLFLSSCCSFLGYFFFFKLFIWRWLSWREYYFDCFVIHYFSKLHLYWPVFLYKIKSWFLKESLCIF